jgi:hypothetical protein
MIDGTLLAIAERETLAASRLGWTVVANAIVTQQLQVEGEGAVERDIRSSSALNITYEDLVSLRVLSHGSSGCVSFLIFSRVCSSSLLVLRL